jgi:glycosyltransferase involved in cell wall biosynthesis
MQTTSLRQPPEFHVLSFEGPDAYARAGGIASRITGLVSELAASDLDSHLWFVGDPERPGHEAQGKLHLHRWCQWISAHHPHGVYDGEEGKANDFASSLPPHLMSELAPKLRRGQKAVILAEEWHTVHAVLHLDWLLRRENLRSQVTIFWNANNVFGFDRIDWRRLASAATLTTVSRYMRHVMQRLGADAIAIPNGLGPDAFLPIAPAAVREVRRRGANRLLLAKVARFDPDKQWLQAIDVIGALKASGLAPLLIARGGIESHGNDVLLRCAARGLRVRRVVCDPKGEGLVRALEGLDSIDVLFLESHLDAEARRLLFRSAGVVLANSSHEPFGLVGLEAMAAGGVACTGCSGEDYAVSGRNALVLQTSDPTECVGLIAQVARSPEHDRSLRRAGQRTAREYAWSNVISKNLLPRIELADA